MSYSVCVLVYIYTYSYTDGILGHSESYSKWTSWGIYIVLDNDNGESDTPCPIVLYSVDHLDPGVLAYPGPKLTSQDSGISCCILVLNTCTHLCILNSASLLQQMFVSFYKASTVHYHTTNWNSRQTSESTDK